MSISQVIKYEGDNTTLIWKHPIEDFNSTTQLIVHETQEAVFFMNGQPLDLFGAGRHTLETQNIPVIKKFFNMPTGDVTPFHCEVYYINKAEQMAVKWGTDSKVQFIEPTYNFPLQVGASGEMSISVEDSRKLLLKMVGTETYLSQGKFVINIRSFLITRIKSYLAQTIKDKAINIFEIDEHLNELSSDLQGKISIDFNDYGVVLKSFFVTTILKPDGDPNYERFKSLYFRQYADVAEAQLQQKVGLIEQQTEAQKMVIEAQGIAQKRNLEGFTYQEERGYDVAEKIAQNEGVGEFSNMGIGLGLMTGVGGTIGNKVGGVINNTLEPMVNGNIGQANPTQASPVQVNQSQANTTQNGGEFCSNCCASIGIDSAFCDECGTKVEENIVPVCSCGYKFEKSSNFCPKCGAKRNS